MKKKSLLFILPWLLFSLSACDGVFAIGDLNIGKDTPGDPDDPGGPDDPGNPDDPGDPDDPSTPDKSDPVIDIYVNDSLIFSGHNEYGDAGSFYTNDLPTFSASVTPSLETYEYYLDSDSQALSDPPTSAGSYYYYIQVYGNDLYNEAWAVVTYELVDDIDPGITLQTYAVSNLGDISINGSTYNTGNYGSSYLDGVLFDFYRMVDNDSYISLLDREGTIDYAGGCLRGSFRNTDPFYQISKIEIMYSSTSGLRLKYGHDPRCDGGTAVFASTQSGKYSTKSVSLNIENDYNFFYIETNGADVLLRSLEVQYANESNSYTSYISYDSGNKTNIAPISGSKVSGVTTGQAKDANGNMKTYTYYDQADVSANYMDYISQVTDIFLTNPVDVCNYYALFGVAPLNYFYKKDSSDFRNIVKQYFSSYERQISEYSNTNGYVLNFPSNGGTYYELDIALSSSYTVNSGGRGVGRIVVWASGFSCYNNTPVFTYTDDHYATFMEYKGDGTFAHRFDSRGNLSNSGYAGRRTLKTGYQYTELGFN